MAERDQPQRAIGRRAHGKTGAGEGQRQIEHRRAGLLSQGGAVAVIMDHRGQGAVQRRQRHRIALDQRIQPLLPGQERTRIRNAGQAVAALHTFQIECPVCAGRLRIPGKEMLQPRIVQHGQAGRLARHVEDRPVEGGIVADVIDVEIGLL